MKSTHPHNFDASGDCTAEDCYATESRQYIIYVERDPFPDPLRYPDGIAWRSGIIDAEGGAYGEEIDGEGDIATYEEARKLALSTLSRLI